MTVAAFKLTPEYVAERDIHESAVAVLNRLLLPPAFFFSAAIGATKLSAQQAAALTRAGVKRGLPDLFVIAPSGIYGIEFKAHNGRLSKTRTVHYPSGATRILEGQQDVFPRLMAAGMIITVAHSVEEMLAALERWEIPLRRHHR